MSYDKQYARKFLSWNDYKWWVQQKIFFKILEDSPLSEECKNTRFEFGWVISY